MKRSLNFKTRLLVLFSSGFFLFINCQKRTEVPGGGPPPTTGRPDTNTYANLVYTIAPKITDPLINKAPDDHLVCITTNPVKRNLLYVFLPGTHRNPVSCRATVLKAATLGFHSIGLMYDNAVPVNPMCSTGTDVTCHSRARREVIDGVDRHPSINTNVTESIINRLVKLLKYLTVRYPGQGWDQYINDQQPDWSKIIIAGHSQGGCVAGVIGKYYPVKKVLMYAAADFMTNGSIPDWEQLATDRGKYFALINVKDEQVPYDILKTEWGALGMTEEGNSVDVSTGAPYDHSHALITTVEPPDAGVDRYHNSLGVDAFIPKDSSGKYVYDAVWEYMMTEGN